MSGIGDINGDTLTDIALGAQGADSYAKRVEVILGRNNSWPTSLSLPVNTTADGFEIKGEAADNYLGSSIAEMSDFNGGNINDFAIGTPYFLSTAAGKAHILLGSKGTWPLSFNASMIGSSVSGVTQTGPLSTYFGRSLATG